MSESKHTPGDWFVFGNGHCVGAPDGGVAMCSMRVRTEDEWAANARLITGACNSYKRHFGINSVEAAESDKLGDAIELLRRFQALPNPAPGHSLLVELAAFLASVEK